MYLVWYRVFEQVEPAAEQVSWRKIYGICVSIKKKKKNGGEGGEYLKVIVSCIVVFL